MATTINYLSIAFSIGGQQLILETTQVPTEKQITVAAATDASSLATSLKDLIMHQTYKMEAGKVISVPIKDFFDSVGDKFGDTGKTNLTNIFEKFAKATTGIDISLWDLYITTTTILVENKPQGQITFGFKVKVEYADKFYTNLNIPNEITKIISLDSLGLGIAYYKTFAMP